jgi:hypothetical protein
MLVFVTFGLISGSASVEPAEPILKLTPDKNRYFLGPHLSYLEDPQKKLSIDDVSSPQMKTRFVKHAGNMINFGLDSSAYWIRFTVDAFQVQIHQKKWLLYFDWPNSIDHATLYIPFYIFHQTIILCVGLFVIRWNIGIGPKYLIIALVSFALIMALYDLLVRRFNVVRFFFGMRPKKKPSKIPDPSPARTSA